MMLRRAGVAAALFTLAAAHAEDCHFDLAATRNYELGYPVKAMPTPDGSAVVYLRAGGPRDTTQHLYEYDIAAKHERELVTPAALLGGGEENLSVEEKARRERARVTVKGFTDFQLTADGAKVMLSLSGKLYLVDRRSGKVENVPGEGWIAPRLATNGKVLAAVKDNDLHVIDLASGSDIKVTSGGGELLTHGVADFIAAEELNRWDGAWWSPDGQWLAFEEADNSKLEPHYIASAGDPAQAPNSFRYPRTGTENSKIKVGIVGAKGGATVWAQWDNAAFPYLARVVWPKQGPLTILVMNRDQTEMRLLAIDPASGAARELLRETDSAWLNTHADDGRNPAEMPRWTEDGKGFLWASEKSGQWQLELHGADGKLIRKLTPDGFRFGGLVEVDDARGEAVIAGGPDRLANLLYRVDFKGGDPKPLAAERGSHHGEFGGGHELFVDNYSLTDGNRGVDLRKRDGSLLATLPNVAEKPAFLPNVSYLAVGAHQLDAQVVKPHDFVAGRKYPVLLSVYAGPTVKNVTATPRRAFAQQCMADHGFIVVTVDNRGTPGRDRSFERVIKGNLIDIALADQVEGVQALGAEIPEMDMKRVGVYGWSFGGFFSAMATIRRPDVFAAGIAGAPVIDWQDYDTAYTERYLKQPKDNEAGYKASSVLTYAAQLSRPLLLVHGLTDDNVYFEHSYKLTQALLAAGKPYELLLLPGTHQLPDPNLRAQLERREMEFFTRNLK